MASCLICGAGLRDSAKFCGKCGSRQDAQAARPAAVEPLPHVAQPEIPPVAQSAPSIGVLGHADVPHVVEITTGSLASAGAVVTDGGPLPGAVIPLAPMDMLPSPETLFHKPEAPLKSSVDEEVVIFERQLDPDSGDSAQEGATEFIPYSAPYSPPYSAPPIPTLRVPPVAQPKGSSSWALYAAIGVGVAVLAGGGYALLSMKRDARNTQPSATVATALPIVPAQPLPTQISPENRTLPVPPGADASQGEQRLATEKARLELSREAADLEKHRASDEKEVRAQAEVQRQRDAESQQKALADSRVRQEEQQRQLEDTQRKLADERARADREEKSRREAEDQRRQAAEASATRAPAVAAPPPYRGPSSGDLIWEGNVQGTELITIDNGQTSSGSLTGSLPGVAVLIQPVDPKKVSIASSPGPRNSYNRVVLRVAGNGKMRVVLKWSLP
jgi:hypothetical protein